METFYLIDFENVHDTGITNIEKLKKTDYAYIFSTKNATNIRPDIFWLDKDNIKPILVPTGKQSLDMHLVSYLGYLLGIHGKDCSYVIISKDKDYDNIVNFWKGKGYLHICRKEKLPGNELAKKKTTQSVSQPQSNPQTANNKIIAGMSYKFNGKARSKLNLFMQHELVAMKYDRASANRICKIVVAHCNDEKMLSRIHNDLRNEFEEKDYGTVYEDVKNMLEKFVQLKDEAIKI